MGVFEYMSRNSEYILEKLMEHIFLFLASWSIAVVVGIAIGVLVTRPGKRKIGRVVLAVTGATQAVPSIAVIALVFLFMGIGATPAVFALFLYSLVPIVFNTASGLMSVSPKMKEAAKGMGMKDRQILWKVEFPVTIPTMLSGIRSSATINIGTAAIAASIGAGGLGEIIFTGLRMSRGPMIIAGAIPVTILAITVDIVLGLSEKAITSKGLRV